jgi:hypothetical protein
MCIKGRTRFKTEEGPENEANRICGFRADGRADGSKPFEKSLFPSVFNRSKDPVRELVEAGAQDASILVGMGRICEVIVLSFPSPECSEK